MTPRILKNEPGDVAFEFEIPEQAAVKPGDTVKVEICGPNISIGFISNSARHRLRGGLRAPLRTWRKWRLRRAAEKLAGWKARRDTIEAQVKEYDKIWDKGHRQYMVERLVRASDMAALYEERVEQLMRQ
jgi:hypothetical protein